MTRRLSDQQAQAERMTADRVAADHDLLIEIKTKLDGVMTMLASKADADQVKDHGQQLQRKADAKQVEDDLKDHEHRIRSVESLVWKGLGALAAAQIAWGLYVKYAAQVMR